MKQTCTEIELGSDVPSSEMTERKNALKEETMTNGEYPTENDFNEVETALNEKESSSLDLLNTKVEEANGESNKNVNKSLDSVDIDTPSHKGWHYSGHFGSFSKHASRSPVTKQPYVSNACSEKYYNQNAHYGRDKSCLRTIKWDSKKETVTKIDSSSNDSLSNHTTALSQNKRTNDSEVSPKIVDDNSIAALPDKKVSSDIKSTEKTSNANEVQISTVNDGSELRETLSNPDTAEAVSDFMANALAREENQTDDNFSTSGKSSPLLELESTEADTESKSVNDSVVDVVAADLPVAESINADENSTGLEEAPSNQSPSNPTEDGDKVLDNSMDAKDENTTSEMRMEVEDGGESALEDTKDGENGKNFMAEIDNELEDDEKSSLQIMSRSENHVSGESEEIDDSENTPSEAEVKVGENGDEGVSGSEVGCSNDETVPLVKADESVTEKNEKGQDTVGKKDENCEKNFVAKLVDESGENTQEISVSQSVQKNRETRSKKQIKETTEGLNAATEVDLVDETKENGLSITTENLDNSISSQLTNDSTAVAIDESKRNDEKTNVLIDENITSDETKISLADGAKEDISLSNDNEEKSVNDNGTDKVATLRSSLKRTLSEIMLDEMDLSKRIQMKSKKSENTSESTVKENDSSQVLSENVSDAIAKTDKNIDTPNVENTVTNSNGENLIPESVENTIINNVVEKSFGPRRNVEEKNAARSDDHEADDDERMDDCEVIEVPAKRKQKRSRKSLNTLRENAISQDDTQEYENVRQKRKTAQNAEEMIRKECLANTDSESNDSLSKFIVITHKPNNNSRATSPPTLKRNYVDDEIKSEGTATKKLKSDVTLNGDISTKSESVESETKQTLHSVRQFFRREANGSLCKLRQEDLEELLIQKIVETITMKGEIGKLREQAKVSERNQEATRLKCQQLAKQVKDFEMVLSRFKADLRSNPDSKTVVPIKINRSVGLQVNFVTDHGIQNLRQLQQAQKIIAGTTMNGVIAGQQQQQFQQQKQPAQQVTQPQGESVAPGIKRTVKVRSPRRPENSTSSPVISSVSTPVNSPHASTITPAALVVTKAASDSRPSVTTANQQPPVLSSQLLASNTIVVNGTVANPIRQTAALQASKTKNSDLIDLTQEEEKTKTPVNNKSTAAHNETSPSVSNVQKIAPRFHTVIQTIPGNMAITAQSGIRVVQPSSQPTPTALVNNMNAPRLAYVTMQSGIVPRQVVLTSTPTPIRPAPTNTIRATFPITGTINNSTVRVIPATGAPPLIFKHPAALPESSNSISSPSWKLPPPAPSLKISKVPNGIVLSWNMALSDKYAEIASYQLYAYQEISGIAPSSSLWKKVGDVRALPLPMACTLTQFSEGNNYYFAVRAVDKHSRLGQYSQPGNISL
ncbi:activating transcription factor 7-interacting protein 1 isoform X2 [Venturia canescens]|nr:activating transcription factor 7-interacting protein 1 isoform X2 [Venturia canescens]